MAKVKIELWSRLKAQVSGVRKMDRHEHRGGCHCGNLRWTLRSALSLIDLPVRTCGCDFCRKHGLLTTSDPLGELDFMLTDRQAVIRYRFGTKTADFLMCGRCGVYVGAQMEQAGRYYAVTNLRTLENGGEMGPMQPSAAAAPSMPYLVRRARASSRAARSSISPPPGVRTSPGLPPGTASPPGSTDR